MDFYLSLDLRMVMFGCGILDVSKWPENSNTPKVILLFYIKKAIFVLKTCLDFAELSAIFELNSYIGHSYALNMWLGCEPTPLTSRTFFLEKPKAHIFSWTLNRQKMFLFIFLLLLKALLYTFPYVRWMVIIYLGWVPSINPKSLLVLWEFFFWGKFYGMSWL